MRLLHTSDWHLGQILHGAPRAYEHERFFAWLLLTLERERVDALIVAGDVFDVASPSSAAQSQYYGFLAECRKRLPTLDVLVVGGNHDSPARLDAPATVLGALGVHVIGGVTLEDASDAELDRLIVPLHDARGEVGAWALGVPFLRRRDLPSDAVSADASTSADPTHQRLIDGYRHLYAALVERAQSRATDAQALVATGHCYMADGQVSELSERKIQVGHQHALPADVFPDALAYVALGHLHRAQAVAGKANVRYSGSPIPLSLVERTYEHQVVLVELEGARFVSARPIAVPRTVDVWCVPEVHAPLEDVLFALRALPRRGPRGATENERPFLEVRVLLDRAYARLKPDVEEALDGAWPRLLRIDAQRPEREGERRTLARRDLDAISPREVFEAAYRRARPGDPPPALLALFSELLEACLREGES